MGDEGEGEEHVHLEEECSGRVEGSYGSPENVRAPRTDSGSIVWFSRELGMYEQVGAYAIRVKL